MAEELYNVVFKGELVRGHELQEVKSNLSRLFKIEGAKLEALFSGKAITLKKDVNFESANKYRVAIKKAGARVDLQAVEVAKPVSTHGKAVFGEARSAAGTAPQNENTAQVQASSAPSDDAEAGPFQLAPVGAPVLSTSERKQETPLDIDTSYLSIRDDNGNLVDASEIERAQAVDESSFELDLDAVGLAPPGEQLLRADEKQKAQVLEVDISELSIAEPGARLGEAKHEAAVAPDVSHLQLEQ